jgi:WXG100 family type VII secretion target
MLNSGSIVQLDSARFSTSSQALGDRVADLAARRAEIGDAVEALLNGWRGEAATTFRTHWEDWRDGADEVIDGLRRNVASLSLAQADLDRSDDSSVRESTRLQGRLG